MILVFLAIIPSLLWDEPPSTAPAIEKAGIREIAVSRDAPAWSGTRVRATQVDAGTLVKTDAPGVDYQLSRGGATGAPWVNSNLWRELREPGKGWLYEVHGAEVALAVAEAYASGAPSYFRLKQDDLAAFGAAVRFLREIDGPALPPRVNFGLLDDGSAEMEEVMNLLLRRNLLYQPVRSADGWQGALVRLGSREYPKDLAAEPYKFAAVVRSRVGDDRRLVRIYGSDTTIARMYGTEQRARLHLIQYGRNPVIGMRVRVLGRYPRVLVDVLGQRVTVPEDLTLDEAATEFTIPEFRTYAVVDLDQRAPEPLASAHAAHNFALTADPDAEPWRAAPSVKVDRLASGETVPIGVTEIRSRWTDDSLYLLYICPFRRLNLKPDPVTDRDTPSLWNWDVAEAFIGADERNIGQYREFQVSPQGEWVDLDIDVLHPKPDGGIGWNSGYQVKARIDNERRIWYGEMRIPLASIAARRFKSGDRLRLGLFRITGFPDERLLIAWQPTFRRNFHVPEAFGSLVLR